MRHKQLNRHLRRALLAALLAVCCLISAVPAFAADAAETDYIIKRIDSEDGAPFEVVSKAEMERLRDAGLLQWYEPDAEMTLLDGEVSAYYAQDKWDLTMINAAPAFRMGTLGRGVKVGVLDSGVNPVPSLAGKLLPGQNYTDDNNANDTADNYGHGTLVAALIAGQNEDGYLGAAPGAKIVPLKVTDGKLLSTSTVCRAIYGAVDDYGCTVLNLSLGRSSDSNVLREAIDYAAKKGVIVVAAVGNNGNTGKWYPAAYENTIGVGAVDQDGTVYYHSNHNSSVLLTAPGANVKTAGHRGGYTTASGTSFSVPLVTSAVAVLLGIDSRRTLDDIISILKDTAQDAGSTGWDEYYGWGILDLGRSAATALEKHKQDYSCTFTSASTIQNNSGRDIDATYLLAAYDTNGKFLGAKTYRIFLPAGQTVAVEAPDENSFYGQFVFETATIIPLAIARKSFS